jgi:putative peptide zinc metalloprotease protein
MPYHSSAEGVLWLPEEAIVRAGANGFLTEFLVEPGTRVTPGKSLLRSHDPALEAQLRYGKAKVAELVASYSAMFVSDRSEAQIAQNKLESERASLARMRERADELIVQAKTDGIFIAPQTFDMPGRYYRKGEILGYVIGKIEPVARVVVAQEEVDRVRLATERVRVRVVDQPHSTLEGKVLREIPAGDQYLPSPALAVGGGGGIATDVRDANGAKALERMFQFDIELVGLTRVEHVGQRVLVRFEYEMEPLLVQWYRGVRLLFLSRFHV